MNIVSRETAAGANPLRRVDPKLALRAVVTVLIACTLLAALQWTLRTTESNVPRAASLALQQHAPAGPSTSGGRGGVEGPALEPAGAR